MHQNAVLCGNGLIHYKTAKFSNLEAYADDHFSVTQMVQFFFDQVQNILGKQGCCLLVNIVPAVPLFLPATSVLHTVFLTYSMPKVPHQFE